MFTERSKVIGAALNNPDKIKQFPIKTMMMRDLVSETEPDGILKYGHFFVHLLADGAPETATKFMVNMCMQDLLGENTQMDETANAQTKCILKYLTKDMR